MAELTPPEMSDTDIRELVRERYAAAATSIASAEPTGDSCCGSAGTAGSSCCASVSLEDAAGNEVFGGSLYDAEDSAEGAPVQASLGCGVPTAVADLHDGDVVLDLGSGAGADVLISARRAKTARPARKRSSRPRPPRAANRPMDPAPAGTLRSPSASPTAPPPA
jgi:hypothetical protein